MSAANNGWQWTSDVFIEKKNGNSIEKCCALIGEQCGVCTSENIFYTKVSIDFLRNLTETENEEIFLSTSPAQHREKSEWISSSIEFVTKKKRINTIRSNVFFYNFDSVSLSFRSPPFEPCSVMVMSPYNRKYYLFSPLENCSNAVFALTHKHIFIYDKRRETNAKRTHTHTNTHEHRMAAHGNIVVFKHAEIFPTRKSGRTHLVHTHTDRRTPHTSKWNKKRIKCWKNPIKHRHSTPKILSNEKLL